MDLKTLDFIFPFVSFFYGSLVLFVLELPLFKKLTQKNETSLLAVSLREQLQVHKPLAWICFFVGGLWSLQNLLI